MNIELTLNYIQRIDKRLAMLYYISFQILCLPSDDSVTLKLEMLSYSCQIVTRACHTFVTYFIAAIPGEVTLLTHYVSHHDAVANNPVILLLYN